MHEAFFFFFFSLLPFWSVCIWRMLHDSPSPKNREHWSLLCTGAISNHQKGMKSDKKTNKQKCVQLALESPNKSWVNARLP